MDLLLPCNQCLSPLTVQVRTPLRRGVLDTILCDKVCQWLATGRWSSLGFPVSSTNKTYRHAITEILLKVTLNTIKLTNQPTESDWLSLIKISWVSFLKIISIVIIYSPTKIKHHLTCFKISFLIMNLFQIGLLFSLPVYTYLLTCGTGYWSILFMCIWQGV
jgi:hypothetical protein